MAAVLSVLRARGIPTQRGLFHPHANFQPRLPAGFFLALIPVLMLWTAPPGGDATDRGLGEPSTHGILPSGRPRHAGNISVCLGGNSSATSDQGVSLAAVGLAPVLRRMSGEQLGQAMYRSGQRHELLTLVGAG